MIQRKTKRKSAEIHDLISDLQSSIHVLPKEAYTDCMQQATTITPDPDDVDYLALAIHLHCPLWSNDKRLQNQSRVQILTTDDMMKRLRLPRY